MAALRLQCKRCNREFPSGIATGWTPRPVLGEHSHACQHCGAVATYRHGDYRVAVPMWAQQSS